jgi:hypothetical protein
MAEPTDETQKPGDARHETARTLAERALEHYAEGDRKTGDDLADQAANMDRSAVVEVIEELDEADKPAG